MSAQPKPEASARPAAAGWRPEYLRLWRQLLGASALLLAACLWLSPVRPADAAGVAALMAVAAAVSLTPVVLRDNIVLSPILPLVMAAAGLFGATAAVLTGIVSVTVVALVRMIGMVRGGRCPSLRWFAQAITAPIVTDGPVALLYVCLHAALFPRAGLGRGDDPQFCAWVVLSVCALAASMANALLISYLSSRYFGRRWEVVWHDNLRWTLTSAVLMSPVAFLMGVLYRQSPAWGIAFILLPTWAARAAFVYHERTIGAYKQGVELLGRIMQESHPYTHGHLNRVAHWAKKIAEELRLPPESMQFIEDAAILHDIGKVAVDDRVLNKVGKLTDEDWAMIRRHPVVGAEIVGNIRYFNKVSHWIRHHHERPDGGGYPDKMPETRIPVESGIISVVDAYDAMVGGPAKEDKRPYRDPMAPDAAIAELRRHAGTQFHPDVVEAFIAVLAREKAVEESGEFSPDRVAPEGDSLWDAPLRTAAAGGLLVTSAGGLP